MKLLLEQIKGISIKYPLDYVNCFEQAIAIILNWLKPGRDYLYLAYEKMSKSVWLDNVEVKKYIQEYSL